MSTICPHCGTANPEGANFCSRCGTDLRPGTGERPPEREELRPGRPAPAEEQGQAPQEGAASTAGPAGGAADQPWLRPDFVGEDDVPFEPEDTALGDAVDDGVTDTTDIPVATGRLVSGVQGLLEPIRVATMPGETGREPASAVPVAAGTALGIERLRRVRVLMGEEPLLAAARLQPPRRRESYWVPWIFILIAVAIGVPVFGNMVRTLGKAREWPGVNAAFTAIDNLPPRATVQILWAYDPATAGEMDMVASPVMRHLLDKGVQPAMVSLLPAGPATARRLISTVQDERQQLRNARPEAAPADVQFMPGGVIVLPALGQHAAVLAVVFGAQTEDVQAWLEQVQPRNDAPVVAVTAAGADPALRPYLDSGQLVGLVSGFDGAASYTTLLNETPSAVSENFMKVQLVGQNVAILAFLGLILLGNFAALFGGGATMPEFAGQTDWANALGMWIGFAVALLIFSAIAGDHWLSRFGQHVLVGAALGYAAIVTWQQLWLLPFVTQLRANPTNDAWNWIPIVLTVMLALAAFERIAMQGEDGPPRGGWQRLARWLGLVPAAFLVGTGVAIILFGAVQGTLLPQFLRAALTGMQWKLPLELFLTGLLALLVTSSVLVFYAVDPQRHLVGQPVWVRRFMRGWLWVGQRAVWLAAGVIFARLVVSRTSLLIAQFEYFRLTLETTALWQSLDAWWRSLTGM